MKKRHSTADQPLTTTKMVSAWVAAKSQTNVTINSSVDEIVERYTEIPITSWTTPWLWNFTSLHWNSP